MLPEQTDKKITTRVEAKLHGETIGWYDNADDAQAAIDAAVEAEEEN